MEKRYIQHILDAPAGITNRVNYEITQSCNLRCLHCSDFTKNTTGRMTRQDLVTFHKKMMCLGVTEAVIGGGEPFTHPECVPLVAELAALGRLTIASNGVFADAKTLIDLLRRYPHIILQISWDGVSEKVFDRIRGQGSYQKAFQTVSQLVAAGLKARVVLSMTVMRPNQDEVQGVVDFARRLGLPQVHFPHLLPVGNARRSWSELSLTADELERLVHLLLDLKHRYQGQPQISSSIISRIDARVRERGSLDCLHQLSLKVNPDGAIFPCPACHDEKMAISWVQDLKDQEPEAIYRAILAKRPDHVKRAVHFHPSCPDCDYLIYCAGRFCENCGLMHPKRLARAQTSHCKLSQSLFHSAIVAHHLALGNPS